MGGRAAIVIPKIPSPASKIFAFMDNHKKEPPHSMTPKTAEKTPRVVLTRALFSQGSGVRIVGSGPSQLQLPASALYQLSSIPPLEPLAYPSTLLRHQCQPQVCEAMRL